MDSLYGRQFADYQQAISTAQEVAKSTGYAFVVRRYSPNQKDARKVYLRCSKGRKYARDKRCDDTNLANKRKKPSQMTDCPFSLIIHLNHDAKIWTIKLSERDLQQSHNHAPFLPTTFPRYRQQTIEMKRSEIIRLWTSGTRPSDIQRWISSLEGVTPVTIQDIYNVLAQYRQQTAGQPRCVFQYVGAPNGQQALQNPCHALDEVAAASQSTTLPFLMDCETTALVRHPYHRPLDDVVDASLLIPIAFEGGDDCRNEGLHALANEVTASEKL